MDVLGVIPGYGEIADAANGLTYLAEGDVVNVGLSFLSCIPVAGDAAGKGSKAANKTLGVAGDIAKHGDDIVDAATDIAKHGDDIVDAATDIAKHGDDIADAAADIVKHGDDAKDLIKKGYKQDVNGRWHRPDGTFASNAEVGISKTPSKSVSSSTTNNRPSWRQSELDANSQFSDYQSQQSFKNGETANYGDKGSVRPDLYKEGHSIDVKNYDVTTSQGRDNLARNIEQQYYQRLEHLPTGTRQSVLIDVRGQDVSPSTLQDLADSISKKTNNGIEIIFKQ